MASVALRPPIGVEVPAGVAGTVGDTPVIGVGVDALGRPRQGGLVAPGVALGHGTLPRPPGGARTETADHAIVGPRVAVGRHVPRPPPRGRTRPHAPTREGFAARRLGHRPTKTVGRAVQARGNTPAGVAAGARPPRRRPLVGGRPVDTPGVGLPGGVVAPNGRRAPLLVGRPTPCHVARLGTGRPALTGDDIRRTIPETVGLAAGRAPPFPGLAALLAVVPRLPEPDQEPPVATRRLDAPVVAVGQPPATGLHSPSNLTKLVTPDAGLCRVDSY